MFMVSFSVICVSLFVSICFARLTEDERVRLWHQHHTWPPSWNEESPSYRNLMEFREQEIMSLTGADERWENWMQFVQGSQFIQCFHCI
jgi:hypothetical protein